MSRAAAASEHALHTAATEDLHSRYRVTISYYDVCVTKGHPHAHCQALEDHRANSGDQGPHPASRRPGTGARAPGAPQA